MGCEARNTPFQTIVADMAAKVLATQTFQGIPVTVLGTPERPLFGATETCRILGIENSRDAVSSLDSDEKITVVNPDGNPRAGIPHQFTAITESGLYALIFKSRKPEARAFRKWVTDEVLPSIRKTGSYSVQSAFEIPKTLAGALRMAAEQAERAEQLQLTTSFVTKAYAEQSEMV